MLERNTDEIRMEIQSCFVKTHEYWEKRRGGKNWIAHIIGPDKWYGYKREAEGPKSPAFQVIV